MSVVNTNPSQWFGGTWQKISTGRVLMGASNDNQLGTTVDSGLPNITGSFLLRWSDNSGQGGIYNTWSGSLYGTKSGTAQGWSSVNAGDGGSRADTLNIDASKSSTVYGKSSIVQPPAYYCYIWRRIS